MKNYDKKKYHLPVYDEASVYIDNTQKISRLDGAGLEEIKDQRRPRLTGHKPSDDEVSFSLPKIGIPNFWGSCLEKTYLCLLEISVYRDLWKQLFI